MMQNLISIIYRGAWVAACLCLFSTLSLAQVPASGSDLPKPSSGTLVPGYIIAKRVTGTVQVLDEATQQLRPLKEGDRLKQGETVITAPDKQSGAILVFSSGATVQLGKNTQLGIERFLQELWKGTYTVSDAEKEPSTSQVKLDMARGEIVGKIIKLDKEHGSSFSIRTPIGVAGVRGTTVAASYVSSDENPAQIVALISVLEGTMAFTPISARGGGELREVSIQGNTEIALQVFAPAGSPPQIMTPPSQMIPAPLSPASLLTLQAVLQQILQAQEALQFAPPPPPVQPSQGADTQQQSQATEQESQQTTSSGGSLQEVGGSAPPAVASPPRITGGDGQARS